VQDRHSTSCVMKNLFRRLKLFSPCINSEFRQILSLCHCQGLLFKRSFLLILYFPGGQCPAWNSQGGQEDYCPPRYATVPGLRKGNVSRCNNKRASPMGAPLQPLRGGTRRGGRGGARPPLVRPWKREVRVVGTGVPER